MEAAQSAHLNLQLLHPLTQLLRGHHLLFLGLCQRHQAASVITDPWGRVSIQGSALVEVSDVWALLLLWVLGSMPCGTSPLLLSSPTLPSAEFLPSVSAHPSASIGCLGLLHFIKIPAKISEKLVKTQAKKIVLIYFDSWH